MEKEKGKQLWLRIFAAVLVFAAAFGVYANTLAGDFVWDDEYLILNNPQIKDFKHLPRVFSTYVGYGSENVNNFYRPLQELSNMLDYRLWGGRPAGFHLTNALLHALVAALVFVFLLRATRDIKAAFAAALLYGVHPVHSEAVAYIAGRADPLYAVFLLGALILYSERADNMENKRKSRMFFCASLVLYAFSLLSKELAVIAPALVFVYSFFFLRDGAGRDGIYRKVKWEWAPFALMAGIYMLLRVTILDFSAMAPSSILGKIPAGYRFLTFLKTIPEYFRLLLLPLDLHMERSVPVARSFPEMHTLAAAAGTALVIWLIFRLYRTQRAISFGLTWFLINLVPVSNIIPINSFMAEHWIYLASVGPFLVVGVMVSRLCSAGGRTSRYIAVVAAASLALTAAGYGFVTVARNRDWNNEISFFESTLKYHPENPRLYLNLGNTYFEKGDLGNALANYRKCTELDPDYAVAYGNIGSVYLREGDPLRAEKYLKRAISQQPNYPIAHYNLGIIRFKRGRYDMAMKDFNTVVEQLPQMYQAWNMIGRIYAKKGDKKNARRAFEKSLEIMPDQPGIRKIIATQRAR